MFHFVNSTNINNFSLQFIGWTAKGRTSNLNFPQWSLHNPIKVCHSNWYSGKINFRFDCKIILPSIKIWWTMYSDSQIFYNIFFAFFNKMIRMFCFDYLEEFWTCKLLFEVQATHEITVYKKLRNLAQIVCNCLLQTLFMSCITSISILHKTSSHN